MCGPCVGTHPLYVVKILMEKNIEDIKMCVTRVSEDREEEKEVDGIDREKKR